MRSDPRSRRASDDAGQIMTSLLILLGFAALMVMSFVLIPYGAANDESARSQTAADAAALAGAEEIRKTWIASTAPGALFFPMMPVPPVTGASGASSASSYAARNGAVIESYTVYPGSGRVHAAVRNTYRADDGRGFATASATAEMDADFSGCAWDDPVPPSSYTPYGPPTFNRTLTCGGWKSEYVIANVVSYPITMYVGTTPKELFEDLEPRLVD